jgi:hypothetical protein
MTHTQLRNTGEDSSYEALVVLMHNLPRGLALSQCFIAVEPAIWIGNRAIQRCGHKPQEFK